MTSEATTLFGTIGIIILFGIEAFVSPEFRQSFKAGIDRKRTVSYLIAAALTLFLTGKMSAIVKGHFPDMLGISRVPLLDYVGCFLFAELMNWLIHYLKHISFLWRFHFQHHIDPKYTVLLTSYTHGGEVLFSGTIIGAIMAMIGFSQSAINTYFLFYALANTYQHSSLNLSLGWLDYLIVSPRYHRIHHSKSFDANYGSTLTFWDIVFKTTYWPARNEVVKDIGIRNSGEPFGFADEMLYFLKGWKIPHFPESELKKFFARVHKA
ncbi:MAG: hypothetical protein COW00_16380 [Bdellovibrio sp. CG12_big_fil_rev_8_21_14_0_65_39_13]|nr:MAG: hypothetical protein COW78_14875 [Bdellovibrio sp. CG22_combo_CG10-13_8_21_14_all_39_27]PIQ58308.1 MAG: hypothetical protein COW00_16380 [Bdellovibrio sp. CG12_big_fil_rev_8_21_14_0_65_39_13]PIR35135.1 MAG: hypothetical protein COV37_10075 [Bdellovibrio sp. CG11_big_fil_rev_8_21_14_0_20_39_38]